MRKSSILLLVCFTASVRGFCADEVEQGSIRNFSSAETPSSASEEEDLEAFDVKPLDGVQIDAVEHFLNPRPSEIAIGAGIYPLDAYATGLGINASFTYRFSQSFAWEIVNGSYVYSYDKGLTTQLADEYMVNPQTIEKLKYVISSNFALIHSRGKLIFLKKYIRNFESSLVLGGGLVTTNENSAFTANFGGIFQIFISNTFSWKLEVRDYLTTTTLTNNLVFNIGTGISF